MVELTGTLNMARMLERFAPRTMPQYYEGARRIDQIPPSPETPGRSVSAGGRTEESNVPRTALAAYLPGPTAAVLSGK